MKIIEVTPELIVNDVQKSIDFYQKELGFTLAQRIPEEGEPVWAEISTGTSRFMMQKWDDTLVEMPVLQKRKNEGITVFVYRLESKESIIELSDKFTNDSITVLPIRETDYGTIEFGISDPDGYVIIFSAEKK